MTTATPPPHEVPTSAGQGELAVVIPYFQRERGPLARAVRSVLEQADAGPVRIVIVDDESPVPAASELEDLAPPERERIQLLEQPNGGPGAARNRALDDLGPGTELVAFLDSDDRWSPDHLRRARLALGAGHDIYLSNWMPLEASIDAYTHFEKLDLAQHEPLDLGPDLYRHRTSFFEQELSRPIGRLSTMVLRREPFADLRFEPRLRCAFEDRLFRLEMARRDPSIVFSTRPEVFSGSGVNVFSSRTWGTPGRLEIARDELLAMRLVRRRFRLSPAELRLVRRIERSARREGLLTFAYLARRQRRLEGKKLLAMLRCDPLLPLLGPLALLGGER